MTSTARSTRPNFCIERIPSWPRRPKDRLATELATSLFLKVSNQSEFARECTSVRPVPRGCTTSFGSSSTTRWTRRWPVFARELTSPSLKNGSCRVIDDGRGIPVEEHPQYPGKSAAEIVLTVLHAGESSAEPATRSRAVCTAWASRSSTRSRRNFTLEVDWQRRALRDDVSRRRQAPRQAEGHRSRPARAHRHDDHLHARTPRSSKTSSSARRRSPSDSRSWRS